MPWKVQTPMSGRRQFVDEYLRRTVSMTTLCACYGISRRIGYKWVTRFLVEGDRQLQDRSRRPLTSPWAVAPELTALLLEARHRHPTWGPRKILDYLTRGIPKRRGRRRAPSGRSSSGMDSCVHVAVTPNRATRVDPPRRCPPRIACGRPTSKATSRCVADRAVIRSPSSTATLGTCSRARRCPIRPPSRRDRCSIASFRSTACPQ